MSLFKSNLCSSCLKKKIKIGGYNVLYITLYLLMEVVEWSARLARKRVLRVRRLLAPSSMMHIIL